MIFRSKHKERKSPFETQGARLILSYNEGVYYNIASLFLFKNMFWYFLPIGLPNLDFEMGLSLILNPSGTTYCTHHFQIQYLLF